jgi:hypothetical protein
MAHGKDEYKKVAEIFVRKIDERKYWPTPVLNSHQWEIYQLLRQHFQKDNWDVLAGVALSTFINPVGHSRWLDILETSVLFAVITETPDASAILLILEPANPNIESFLEMEGIRWIRYAALLSATEFSEQVISSVQQQQSLPPISERKPINTAEFQVTKALLADSVLDLERYESQLPLTEECRTWLWKESPTILHGVALHRIRPNLKVTLDQLAERMIRQSSVDILIHGRGTDNRPLLAVEVDGKPHEKPDQKIKDKAKERVLESFGIPLIRIAPHEADFWLYYRNPTANDRQRKQRFSELLTSIVVAVSLEVMSSVSMQLEINDARLKLHFREDKLTQTLFGRDYSDLTEQQKETVNFSMAATSLDEDYHTAVGLNNFERARALEEINDRKRWPEELLLFTPEPVIFGNNDLGRWAETTFKSEAMSLKIKTPSVRLMLTDRFDDELIQERISVCLIEAIAGAVREAIRFNTPAKRTD